MRRLVETNQLAPAPPMAQQLNDLLDVATGRLTWLRDTVFRTWNPDYKSSSSSSSSPSQQQQLQLESSETSLPKQEVQRPPWRPPDMDARWWFWNLVWALFPAVFIALYCEFRGKPRMLAYQRQRELEELQEIMGTEAAAEMMLKKMETTSAASVLDESFWERMNRIRQELSIWWRGGVDNNADADNEGSEVPVSSVKERIPVKNSSKNIQPTPEAPKTKPLPTKTGAVAEKTSPQQAEVATTSNPLETPAKIQQQQQELLLQRIEQLEAIVQRQEEQRQRELERQLDRLRSSGIHNRAMQDRGSASAVQTDYKARIYAKDSSPKEQILGKKETSTSMSRLAWESISEMAENIQSVIKRSAIDDKPKETRNSTTSSDTEKSVDETANTPESSKKEKQHKELSTAAKKPVDKKEKSNCRKSDTVPSSDQHEDVENIEKRPWWWKVW